MAKVRRRRAREAKGEDLTVTQAARLLSLSAPTVRRLCNSGVLVLRRHPHNDYRLISRQSVLAFMTGEAEPAASPQQEADAEPRARRVFRAYRLIDLISRYVRAANDRWLANSGWADADRFHDLAKMRLIEVDQILADISVDDPKVLALRKRVATRRYDVDQLAGYLTGKKDSS